MLDIFRDKKIPTPPDWIEQALWLEIGLLRSPRVSDGGSYLTDFIASTDDATRIEQLVFTHLQERLRQQFGATRDVSIYLEVTYFQPPTPIIVLKFILSENDVTHPPTRARFALEFAPEQV